jgi:flagellar motility protein MotE (MotC chaperone)
MPARNTPAPFVSNVNQAIAVQAHDACRREGLYQGQKIRELRLQLGLSKLRSNEVKLVVAILLISAVPGCAQAQTPSVPTVSKDDAQKVVAIINADKAKTQTYCDLQILSEQIEQAYEKRDMKLVDELDRKFEALEKTLGPEYVALMDRLEDLDPEKDKLAAEIISVFEPLDRLCTR